MRVPPRDARWSHYEVALIATQPSSPPSSAALATASAVGGIGFGNFPEYGDFNVDSKSYDPYFGDPLNSVPQLPFLRVSRIPLEPRASPQALVQVLETMHRNLGLKFSEKIGCRVYGLGFIARGLGFRGILKAQV